MSKFIVLNPQSGLVISTHKNRELANKSAAKNVDAIVTKTDRDGGYPKKGDVWSYQDFVEKDVIETEQPATAVEVEQTLAECDGISDVLKEKNGWHLVDVADREDGRFSIYENRITGISMEIEINYPTPYYPAVEVAEVETTEPVQTVSYTAKPSDSRCAWWCVQLPADIELNDQRIPAPYLRKGADLELKQGDMLIDSEAMHHRKNRGYRVLLLICVDGDIANITPTPQRKAFIKANGGKDLMHESGDVAGCVRMAVWLRRQPDLSAAVKALQNCN